MKIHTHYDNLRITRNATPGIIKAAYRALSVEYHPDKNPDRDTTRIMQMLNDAYAVLSDPDARAKYDAKVAAQEAAAARDSQAKQDAERQRQATASAAPRRPPEPAPAASASGSATAARQTNPRPTKGVYAVVVGLVILLFLSLLALALA
jgi:curved DNA-binding protein CbpA